MVQGIVLDTLGLAIGDDLKDADRKLEKTKSAKAEIVGRWLGSALEAQIGAYVGAAIGTACMKPPYAVQKPIGWWASTAQGCLQRSMVAKP